LKWKEIMNLYNEWAKSPDAQTPKGLATKISFVNSMERMLNAGMNPVVRAPKKEVEQIYKVWNDIASNTKVQGHALNENSNLSFEYGLYHDDEEMLGMVAGITQPLNLVKATGLIRATTLDPELVKTFFYQARNMLRTFMMEDRLRFLQISKERASKILARLVTTELKAPKDFAAYEHLALSQKDLPKFIKEVILDKGKGLFNFPPFVVQHGKDALVVTRNSMLHAGKKAIGIKDTKTWMEVLNALAGESGGIRGASAHAVKNLKVSENYIADGLMIHYKNLLITCFKNEKGTYFLYDIKKLSGAENAVGMLSKPW
jgi:hypothetical protein